MNRHHIMMALFIVLGLVLLEPLVLRSQLTTATISGTVRDSTGAVIPSAEITIHNTETGIRQTITTDGQGRYLVPNLSLGQYEVQAAAGGFQTEVRSGIHLTLGQQAVINFTLNPGAVTESVTVLGEAPLVDTATSSVGTLVNREQIRDLPLNGRDYTQLALLQPGVVQYREQSRELNRGMGTRMSVSGARHNQVGFRLNGLDISDGGGTTPGSATGHNLGVDAIQEFQVLTNTFSAEYGKSAGGIVNVVHKSGTNELHGSVFEYLRNSALDARNFFDPGEVPPFRRNQFGFSLGGPIRRDRTFFFGSYEALRERLGVTTINLVPSQDAREGRIVPVNPLVRPYLDLLPFPNGRVFANGSGELLTAFSTRSDENYYVIKGDHQLSGSDSLSGSYTFDQGSVAGPAPREGTPIFEESTKNRFQYTTLQETHIFSPTTLNTFRAGFNRSVLRSFRMPLKEVPANLTFTPGIPVSSLEVSGLDNLYFVTQAYPYRTTILNSFQVSDSVNLIRGSHSFKMGMEAYRSQFTYHSGSRTYGGRYGFRGIPDFLAGQPVIFQADDPDAEANPLIFQSMFGFFAQDDVQLTPRLRVNAGLRYEFVTTPRSSRSNEATLVNLTDPALTTGKTFLNNPSLKNFAPRVGFAWDVLGNQRTALRGGFGLYFDQITNYYILPVIESNPPMALTRALDNPPFPGGFALIRSGTAPALFSLQLVQHNLDQPYRIQYNLGIQQEIARNTALAAYYVGAHGVHSTQFYLNVNSRLPQGRTADGRLFFDRTTPRMNPNFSIMQFRATGGDSYYNALQMLLSRRLTAGFQFQVSYTWGKSIDTGDIFSYSSEGLNTISLQNRFQPGLERGLSSFDARQSFVLNSTYDLPSGADWPRMARGLVGGWQVGGILSFASGHPFTPILGFDNADIIVRSRGDHLRPDLAPGRSTNPTRAQNVEQYYDPTSFALPPRGTLGNLARGTMIGPGLAQFDFTLKKRFHFTESKLLEFRSEFFNLFNHRNFRIPDEVQRTVYDARGNLSASAGRITSTSTTSRQIQFSLRVEF